MQKYSKNRAWRNQHWLMVSRTIVIVGILLLSGCLCRPSCNSDGMTRTTSNAQIPVSGSETWTLDEKNYDIESTYIIPFPRESSAQFTVNWVCNCGAKELDDDAALDMAWPLIRHSYVNDLYETSNYKNLAGETQPVGRIGVALIDQEGAHTSGMRVRLSFEEIEERMSGETVE